MWILGVKRVKNESWDNSKMAYCICMSLNSVIAHCDMPCSVKHFDACK